MVFASAYFIFILAIEQRNKGQKLNRRLLPVILCLGSGTLLTYLFRISRGIGLVPADMSQNFLEKLNAMGSVIIHYGNQLISFKNGSIAQGYFPYPLTLSLGVLSLCTAIVVLGFYKSKQNFKGSATTAIGFFWFGLSLVPSALAIEWRGVYANNYVYTAWIGGVILFITFVDFVSRAYPSVMTY
jgi:hypothetical protein